MSDRFVVEKEKVVCDRRTGLMWQREASERRVVWSEGFQYIESLNREKFAGYDDWRYPTKEELATLILPEENRLNGLFIDPAFANQRNCWASSRAGRHESCYADFYYGDLYLVEENYANYFVRAVRTCGEG